MRKKIAARGNMSDSVRKALNAHPKKSPKEIKALLESQNIHASMSLIQKLKYSRKVASRKSAVKKTSKADRIRDVLVSDRSIRTCDVIAKLKAQRVKVSAAQVSFVRKHMSNKPSVGTNGHTTSDVLIATKQFASSIGGLANLQSAIDGLRKLGLN